jgi:PAS domain S-box-containing protein
MAELLKRLKSALSSLRNPSLVHELEKTNQALRDELASEKLASDQMRACFEAASQGILGVSPGGRIALLNAKTVEMFGYSREELLGMEMEELIPSSLRTKHAEHRSEYFHNPRIRPMDERKGLVARRKDGTEFPVEVGLAHVNSLEGALAFGMVSDISERIKAADELHQANDELRRANTEMEQFANIASHDLQEPLRMISSYLQLIERRYDRLLDDDGREFIHYAVDGAVRLKRLISDLLSFSRAGTGAANFRAVNALDLVQNALANLKTALDESGAQVSVEPLPKIMVDPVLFAQVFQNLIANGIKFQKDNDAHITISAVRRGPEWIFSVHDNGIGIERQHLDRIFGIFERLHSSEEYAGSGIGLAITRKIVERHGGRIWAESQPGTGSTFSFSISAETELASAAGGGQAS